MKKLQLSKKGTKYKGKEALIDDDIFPIVDQYNWTYWKKKKDETEYAINQSIKEKTVYLHNYIWNLKVGNIPDGKLIEHVDRNGLNCQISNLRLATPSKNNCNHKIQSNNTSGYVGITDTIRRKTLKDDSISEYPYWHAYIKYEYRYYTKDFYYHNNEEKEQKFQEAMQWRKDKEKEIHKEFVPKDR